MGGRDPDKPRGYYCDGARHKPDCPDRQACPGCLPPCSQRAGWGTDHAGTGNGPCKRHGGSTRNHKTAAEREQARQACALFGLELQVESDPAAVLIAEIIRAGKMIAWLEQEIAMLPPNKQGQWRLYRETRHASGEKTGEAKPHIYVQMWMAERKLAADVAAKALGAGVAQRHIELMEDFARQIVAGFNEFAKRMGWDPSAPEVREAGREALQLVAGGSG